MQLRYVYIPWCKIILVLTLLQVFSKILLEMQPRCSRELTCCTVYTVSVLMQISSPYAKLYITSLMYTQRFTSRAPMLEYHQPTKCRWVFLQLNAMWSRQWLHVTCSQRSNHRARPDRLLRSRPVYAHLIPSDDIIDDDNHDGWRNVFIEPSIRRYPVKYMPSIDKYGPDN